MTKMVDFGHIDYDDEDKPSGFTLTVIGEEDEARELSQGEVAYILSLGIPVLVEKGVAGDFKIK